MNIKCQCPYCNQPLEAESNMLGLVVDCPGCSTKIVVAKGSASPSSVKIHKTDSDDTEPATEKQIAFITRLGGNPSRSLRKFQASRLIEELLSVAPATKYQLEYLKKNGIPIPCDITANRAKEIKAKVEGDKPPSKSLIESLAELGVSIPPKTMRESEDLYDTLINTSMATERQKLEAIRLGGNLPEGLTYLQANKYISDLEQDRDPKDGKPPTKAQLNQIRKLGGSIDKAINNWRAEAYIEELEELKEEEEDEFNERIENAYDLGTDLDAGKWNLPVKRPSKAVMKKAIQYGIDRKRLNFDRLDGGSIKRCVKPACVRRAIWPG